MRNNKGFTLIEVMVVLALLAIISLIAIPMIRNDWKYFDTLSQDLMYDLRYAREETMRKGTPLGEFSIDTDSYTNAKGEVIKIRSNYSLSKSGSDIKFKGDGSLNSGSSITIKISKTGSTESRTIVINSLGNIYLKDN